MHYLWKMRSPYDALAKRVIPNAVLPINTVRTEEEILPNARRIDLWTTPRHDSSVDTSVPHLQLFAKMWGRGYCVIEPYHCAPGAPEWWDCMEKQKALASREGCRLPALWVLSAGNPKTLIAQGKFERMEGWPKGFYQAVPLLHGFLVVISELPRNRSTLLLRLLGAGKTLALAQADLRALPASSMEWEIAMRALVELHLDTTYTQTQEGSEMLANFDETYRLWKEQERQTGRQQGRQEGRQEGFRDMLTQQLDLRFPNQGSEIKKLLARCQQDDLLWLSMAILQVDTAETLETQLKARLDP